VPSTMGTAALVARVAELLAGRTPRDPDSKRRWPRKRADLPATVQDETATVIELSYEGLRFEVEKPAVAGRGALDIRLPLSDLGHQRARGRQQVLPLGPTGYGDQVHSIMDVLMKLPPETRIHPGHTLPSTISEEWEQNPFIRIWRGLDREGTARCTAMGRPATLVLLGRDYDGGTKAWVRWPDGTDDIVPGSRVEREA